MLNRYFFNRNHGSKFVIKFLFTFLSMFVCMLASVASQSTPRVITEKEFTYDLNGNQVKVVTPRGHEILFEYDEMNRTKKRIFPDGSFVSYEYDLNGNRTRMADENGQTDYVYDSFDRMVTYVFRPQVYGESRTKDNGRLWTPPEQAKRNCAETDQFLKY